MRFFLLLLVSVVISDNGLAFEDNIVRSLGPGAVFSGLSTLQESDPSLPPNLPPGWESCPDEVNAIYVCVVSNTAVCQADNDPSFCNSPDPDDDSVIIDPENGPIPCDKLQNAYCNLAGACCEGLCEAEYRAGLLCLATTHSFCTLDTSCSSNGGDGGNQVSTPGGGACFSATSTVNVLHQGPVEMQDLQVGDQVLTGKPGQYTYQPIYAFGHLNKDANAEFYAISTDGSTTPLEMTGEHLIHVVGKSHPVRADSLKVGDALLISDSSNGAAISSIKVVEKAGLYAPLTADGTLVVNDIAVSAYIALQDSDERYYQVNLGGGYKIALASHQSFVHLYLAPFRMLCMGVSSDLCQTLDENGIPFYIGFGMKLVHWVGEQSMLIQVLFLLVTLPILGALLVLELCFGSSLAPLVMFAAAILAKNFPADMMMKKRKTKSV